MERGTTLRNLLAGVALAATDIPQVLGYTKIAGMPVVTGLYTLLLPLIAFAAFGSSRYLVVAADSATAAIFAGGVAGMATPGDARYIALAGATALLTALMLLLARVLKLGFIADFLSRTVLVGFLIGVGVQVGISVLPAMLGVTASSRRPVVQLAQVARALSHASVPTMTLSAVVVAAVLLLHRIAPKVPGAMIAVVASIAASAWGSFAQHGIATIGAVAGGLPRLRLSLVSVQDVQALAPIAASCAVMILTQSAATARIYAARHHEEVDENEDLLGLAAANTAAAFSGAFVVNGSPTQTAMAESAGASSQTAQLSTAAVTALILLFFTGPLAYLPRCVLGVLVFLVALKLIDLKGLWRIRVESPGEFALAVATAAVVVLWGVEQGIVVAMAASLLRIVHHSYHPDSGVMIAADEGRGVWTVLPVTPQAMTIPGLTLYRFGASLFYANAGRFLAEVTRIVGAMPSPVRWVVIDAEAMTHIDYSAARVVVELQRSLATAGITLAFARISGSLRADLDRHCITQAVGAKRLFYRLHDALAAYEAETEQQGAPGGSAHTSG